MDFSASGHKPEAETVMNFRSTLLAWYDRHARKLPWRSPPGTQPDPYHVWLSEIMLQQTTVQAVIPYFQNFTSQWPTIRSLAEAPAEDIMRSWAGLGYYARARNLHKCAKIIADEYRGVFPRNTEALRTLPGIGDYTSAAIAAIAFGQQATVIDGNVERIAARIFRFQKALPRGKKDLARYAATLSEGFTDRPGDFAQAMMDLGATVCTPKTPACGACPVNSFCKARSSGESRILPIRENKPRRPRKSAFVYWIEDGQGSILLEKRPSRGMLGGMTGLPTSNWIDPDQFSTLSPTDSRAAPLPVEDLGITGIKVHHIFTHFEIELHLIDAKATDIDGQNLFFWKERKDLENAGLPTLFRKVVRMKS